MDKRPIGIFDSGVGGLTVAVEIQKLMPNENIIYLGDTARVPYGAKTPETILKYGGECIEHLISRDVKAVIIACGTVSSNAYGALCGAYDIPLIDVIRPGVKACAAIHPARLGLIATEATVKSGAFIRLLSEACPGIEIYAKACPLFVPLVEEGWINHPVTQSVAEVYLGEWADKSLDLLVLGCTHYPLLSEIIGRVLAGPRLLNLAEYTALAAREKLTGLDLLNDGGNEKREIKFYVTGDTEKFKNTAEMILKKSVEVERVSI